MPKRWPAVNTTPATWSPSRSWRSTRLPVSTEAPWRKRTAWAPWRSASQMQGRRATEMPPRCPPVSPTLTSGILIAQIATPCLSLSLSFPRSLFVKVTLESQRQTTTPHPWLPPQKIIRPGEWTASRRYKPLKCMMGDAIHQNKRHTNQTTLRCFFCLFLTYLTDSFYFLAALGLPYWTRAFSSCGEPGLLFIAVPSLLTAVAFLVEHRL